MEIAVSVVSTIFKYYCIRTYMDTALKRKQNVPVIRRGIVFFTAFVLHPALPNLGLPGNFLLLLSLNLIYVWCNYDGKKWKLLFHTMLLQIMVCLCEYPVLMVSAWLFTEEQRQEAYVIRILMLMSWAAAAVMVTVTVRIFPFSRRKDMEKRDWMLVLSLVCSSVLLLFFLNIMINYKYGISVPYFDMTAMMLMMILPVTALKSYDFLSRHAALKTKILLYEKEMEVCRQHTLEREYTLREFQRLGKSMEESLDRIETLVSENRPEEAVSYIRRLLSETGKSSYGLVSSGNMMIDGLVNYKASYIRALHIGFSAEIRIPADIEVQEENLCIILGNLLDNAVEGTEKVAEAQRRIHMEIMRKRGSLLILIENTCREEMLRIRGDSFLTTKKGGNHGIGLSSVEQAAEELHGSLEVHTEKGIFCASVILPVEK